MAAGDNTIPPPPPPPPGGDFPPFPGGDGPMGGGDNGNQKGSGLNQQNAPAVSSSPGKALMVLGGMIAFVVFMLFQIFGGDDDAEKAAEATALEPKQVARTAGRNDEPIELPPLIQDPGTLLPPPPPPEIEIITPSLPASARVPVLRDETDEATKELLRQRQRSQMVIVDETGGFFDDSASRTPRNVPSNSNDAFEQSVLASNTEAEKVEASHIGNLRQVIAQGRLIHAVMESGINTDLPGPIRAIVSRDIYAEAGRDPLIPRGSRLIGRYNSEVNDGQARVMIIWTRVIRPDGVDVMIGSSAVDQLGMAGVRGSVDSKFMQLFAQALLTSTVNIGIAIAADEVINDDQGVSQSQNDSGSTTESGSAAGLATVDALDRLGSVTERYLERFLNVRPTITVDQGTKLNVFVNRDLIFPDRVSGTRVIQ